MTGSEMPRKDLAHLGLNLSADGLGNWASSVKTALGGVMGWVAYLARKGFQVSSDRGLAGEELALAVRISG